MTDTRLLIFPLDLDDAEPFIRIATALGVEVIGASSAMTGPGDRAVNHFIRLPFVTSPAFNLALRDAICQYGITTIFAPHQGVWRHLDTLLRMSPDDYCFKLCRPDPFTATAQLYSRHEEWAVDALHSVMPERIGVCPVRTPLSRGSYAALHRLFFGTPGQCDENKLQALSDIVRLLPPGDMLEVGCLYGRSAVALGYLAGQHRIGSLICVDPWNITDIVDQGTQADVLNIERANIDFEKIFRIYLSAVAPLGNAGYIRKTSEAAHPVYEAARVNGQLDSPELGSITLLPHLSLLHVDGNHRYDQVRMDVEIWSRHLAHGGWLLLDDYVWAFGDGPRLVGDELLASPLYDSAFVDGDTLFLRRNSVVADYVNTKKSGET